MYRALPDFAFGGTKRPGGRRVPPRTKYSGDGRPPNRQARWWTFRQATRSSDTTRETIRDGPPPDLGALIGRLSARARQVLRC